MGIRKLKTGIKKFRNVAFNWEIENYDISKTYKNKHDIGESTIMLLLRPEYSEGRLVSSSPQIMFQGSKISDCRFIFSVKALADPNFNVNIRSWLKLFLNYTYHSHNFLTYANHHKALSGQNLTMSFDFSFIDFGYEQVADFDYSKFPNDFLKIFQNQKLCDCEFIVNGNSINGHKFFINAHSKVLAEKMEEADNKLAIQNCSEEAFNEFMTFIYSGKIFRKDINILIQLVSLADTYQMNHLKKYSESIMFDSLNCENSNLIFQTCFKYNLSDDLKKKSFTNIQEMFSTFNQKLPDGSIEDPEYVNNLIQIAQILINGLKNKNFLKENKTAETETFTGNQLLINTNDDENLQETQDNGNGAEITQEMLDAYDYPKDTIDTETVDFYNDLADVIIEEEQPEHTLNETFSAGDPDEIQFDFEETQFYGTNDVTNDIEQISCSYTLEDIPEENESDEHEDVITAVAKIKIVDNLYNEQVITQLHSLSEEELNT